MHRFHVANYVANYVAKPMWPHGVNPITGSLVSIAYGQNEELF